VEVGTSSTPVRRKGKHPITWSLRKNPDTAIILPRIPEGVQFPPTLLGCVKKLKYLNHDVVDVGKFPEFVQQFYMENIGTYPFGDPMMQPNKWAAGLANTGILKFVEIPHFGRGKEVNKWSSS
jgi:hypothetical protein